MGFGHGWVSEQGTTCVKAQRQGSLVSFEGQELGED